MLPTQKNKIGLLMTPSLDIEESYWVSFTHSYMLPIPGRTLRAPEIIAVVGRL